MSEPPRRTTRAMNRASANPEPNVALQDASRAPAKVRKPRPSLVQAAANRASQNATAQASQSRPTTPTQRVQQMTRSRSTTPSRRVEPGLSYAAAAVSPPRAPPQRMIPYVELPTMDLVMKRKAAAAAPQAKAPQVHEKAGAGSQSQLPPAPAATSSSAAQGPATVTSLEAQQGSTVLASLEAHRETLSDDFEFAPFVKVPYQVHAQMPEPLPVPDFPLLLPQSTLDLSAVRDQWVYVQYGRQFGGRGYAKRSLVKVSKGNQGRSIAAFACTMISCWNASCRRWEQLPEGYVISDIPERLTFPELAEVLVTALRQDDSKPTTQPRTPTPPISPPGSSMAVAKAAAEVQFLQSKLQQAWRAKRRAEYEELETKIARINQMQAVQEEREQQELERKHEEFMKIYGPLPSPAPYSSDEEEPTEPTEPASPAQENQGIPYHENAMAVQGDTYDVFGGVLQSETTVQRNDTIIWADDAVRDDIEMEEANLEDDGRVEEGGGEEGGGEEGGREEGGGGGGAAEEVKGCEGEYEMAVDDEERGMDGVEEESARGNQANGGSIYESSDSGSNYSDNITGRDGPSGGKKKTRRKSQSRRRSRAQSPTSDTDAASRIPTEAKGKGKAVPGEEPDFLGESIDELTELIVAMSETHQCSPEEIVWRLPFLPRPMPDLKISAPRGTNDWNTWLQVTKLEALKKKQPRKSSDELKEEYKRTFGTLSEKEKVEKRAEWANILATEARSMEEKLVRHNASYIEDFQHLSQRVSATGLAETITFYLGTDPALTRHSRIILGNDLLRDYIEKEDVSVREFLNYLSTSLQFIKNSKYTVRKEDIRLFNFAQSTTGSAQSSDSQRRQALTSAPAAATSSNSTSATSQQTTTQPESPWKKGIPKFEFDPDRPRPATVSEEVWNMGPDNPAWRTHMDSLLGDAFLYGARFWCVKAEANEQPQVWKVRVFRFWFKFVLHSIGYQSSNWVNVIDTFTELEIRVLNWPLHWGIPGRDFKDWRPTIRDGLDEVLEIICGVREGDPIQVVPWTEEEKNIHKHVNNADYLAIPVWMSSNGTVMAQVAHATNLWLPILSRKNAAEDHPDFPLQRSRAIMRPKTTASGQPTTKKRGAERAGPSRQRRQVQSHTERRLEEVAAGGSRPNADNDSQDHDEQPPPYVDDYDYNYDYPNGYGYNSQEDGYDDGHEDGCEDGYDGGCDDRDDGYERTNSHRRDERGGHRGDVPQRNRHDTSPQDRSGGRYQDPCHGQRRPTPQRLPEPPTRQRIAPPQSHHHRKDQQHRQTTQVTHRGSELRRDKRLDQRGSTTDNTADIVRGLMGIASPPPPPPTRKIVADIRELQRSGGRRFASESATAHQQSPSCPGPSYRRGDIVHNRPPHRNSIPASRQSVASEARGPNRQRVVPRERAHSAFDDSEGDHRRKRRRVAEGN
ncbi:hypothetical protein CC1G_12819 [Coprinopsis cinerea okayama7|uniref:Uncharacterized protein n=1 Tax=Coprinopsis cinerea (strain Okayama-7 / 130 / ATCC MYA-4618 / FGSC 9003) TaxID=240176 RepID=A8PD72_COPC7|nr:hypothetical protein CC1G_12819 [Coprinopsis cinerea okayama7\|eukprot:XP_001840546.2 hypothetical protein CC1G_12819 [Coprinopsis cinerea okayama7\